VRRWTTLAVLAACTSAGPAAAQNSVIYQQYAPRPQTQAPNVAPWQYRQQPGIRNNFYQAPGSTEIATRPPVDRRSHRHTWTASDGSMRFDRVGRGEWVETNPFGQYPLQETGRSTRTVQLFDPSTGNTARLYNRQMYSLRDGWQLWDAGPSGGWR
jgi:hypothetical protein